MGLIILGSENLASDQADQKPDTSKRSMETTGPNWPEPYIEKVNLGGGNVKAIFHFYKEWPEDDWTAAKSALGGNLVEVDMSESSFTAVGTRAFFEQSHLKKVTLPKKLETIQDYAFYKCSSLDLDELPDSVSSIGLYAFGYSTITMAKLPENLKTISGSAFYHSSITVDRIPSTVESVGANAFNSCPIKNIEIAAKELKALVFQGCTQLEKVWFRSTCETVAATGSASYPFRMCSADLEIYAEPDSKPAGWESYYNYTSNDPAVEVTVVYGQTTSPF